MQKYDLVARYIQPPSFRRCAIVFLLALGTMFIAGGAAAPSRVAAQEELSDGPVYRSFVSASRRWEVPLQVLMAVGYVESRWEQRDGEPSLDNGYGIMHLTEREDGTMARASALSGLPPDALKKEAAANIEGGAALLSDISHKLFTGEVDKKSLSTWFEVVGEYSGAPDVAVRDGYAREVFRVIRLGARATLSSGEVVELAPMAVGELPESKALAPNSDDYPPALWVPANSNNYTVGRPYGPLSFIIIHDTEGSYASAISWFQNPNSGVSAHYVIRSSDGQITQMVRDANTAYHAGNWDYNVRALGIEHEGFMSQQGWYTEAMYQSSSALARWMADRYGIKKDRAHIISHVEVPGATHQDPGPYWNWTYYMSLVRRDYARAALVDNTDAGFAPIPAQIDPQHYWWTYQGGYNGSNTYSTLSVTAQQYSVNSATWTAQLQDAGYYDVYAFVPWVDNNTADTGSAKYKVYAADGLKTSTVSQKAITDRGNGSWAHIGKYYFNGDGADARIYLDDFTGESGRNVWFDAVMWIPDGSGGPPPPTPTATRTPSRTPTARPTNTVRPTNTAIPEDTATPEATWTPGPCGMRFTDLPDNHWAYPYVGYLYCNSIIGGYQDGTFRPNAESTRGQFAKMIVVGMGWQLYDPVYPTFTDVPVGSTYFTYVETAFLRGVFGGYPDGTFRPNAPVTRAQAAKMLVSARGWGESFPPSPTFNDVPSGHWAYGFVEAAASRGVLGGYPDGTFRPDNLVTRAQLSKMLALTLQVPGTRR